MPTIEVKESLSTFKELNMPGSIVTIQKSNRLHLCRNCRLTIFELEEHYVAYEYPGQKTPYRYHFGCLGEI